MKRTGLAIILISAVISLQGCGASDPGQPPLGSISVKAKPDAGPAFGAKAENRAAKTK